MLYQHLIGLTYALPSLAKHRERWLCRQLARVVRDARRRVPFYRELYSGSSAACERIASRRQFAEAVPIVDKERLFAGDRAEVSNLVRDGRLERVRALLSSAGTSGGAVAFALADGRECRGNARKLDQALARIFDARRRSTMLLNCMPMGVSIASRRSLVVSTGTRHDLASRYLAQFAPLFDQTIILAEVPLAKRLVECANAEAFPWRENRVHLVVGSDYLAENLRSYLAGLMSLDLDSPAEQRMFLSSYGMGEAGLNLFFETAPTVRLRRLAGREPDLMAQLLDVELPTVPLLFLYDPTRIYVESVAGEIVVTHLDHRRFQPMVRYNTHDLGGIIPHHRFVSALSHCGRPDLAPSMPLDLVYVYGRNRALSVGEQRIHVPAAQEALFSEASTAHLLTGAFHLSCADGKLRADVQLNPDSASGAAALEGLGAEMELALGIPTDLRVFEFAEYPHADYDIYESKFRYLP